MFDLIVLGGGPAGYHAAIRAAQLGGKVCLVEDRDRLGGVCLNMGCIPTKALIKSVEVLKTVNTARDFGIEVDNIKINFPSMMQRKESLVQNITQGLSDLFNIYKIEKVQGHGTITGPNQIEVGGETIDGKNILIATGSGPLFIPPFIFDGDKVISTTETLQLKTLPKRMVIAGGGYNGCEFAHIFHALGCEVSIVEMMDTLLPGEDKNIAGQMALEFRKAGVGMHLGEKIEDVHLEGDTVQCGLSNGVKIAGEKLLVCIGRKPNIEGIGLGKIGVNVESGKIATDKKMRTNVPSIYSAGDVVDSPMLAHVAFREGIVAAENALGLDSQIDYRVIPHCIFTDPEFASVGLTEEEARAEYGDAIITGRFPFMGNGKALCEGEFQGFIKIIAKSSNEEVLGIHILGARASELISEGSMAIHSRATLGDISRLIHPHPTLSETMMEASSDGRYEAIHLPPKLKA